MSSATTETTTQTEIESGTTLMTSSSASVETQEPSLFDINYPIRYVKCGKASIGTILVLLRRKVNSVTREWKIQDGKYDIFNHIRECYDKVNKLYSDSLKISSSFGYTELIKILFENKLDGNIWAPKDLLTMYVPSPGKFIDRCDSYELVNLLYGKIRMWAIVLKKHGYNRKFSADINSLGDIFENFASTLPQRLVRTNQVTVSSKNDETGEIEESLHDVEEFYEEFADLVFVNLRNIEVEERTNSKKNNFTGGSNTGNNKRNNQSGGSYNGGNKGSNNSGNFNKKK
jgi:hypothetical protein